MRPSLLLLLALAILTIGLRLYTGDTPLTPDLDRFRDEVDGELTAAGFTTEQVRIGTLKAVTAERGDCSLAIAGEIFHGARLGAFAQFQPEGRPVRIYYQGWVDAYPKVRPLLGQYINRYMTIFGIDSEFVPVILASADPGCDLSFMNLDRFRMHFTE